MTKGVLQTGIAPRATLAVGAVGAIVGGAVSAARNIGKVEKSEMTREAAVKDVLKEAGTTGVSTAAATAVVTSLGLTGLLSLAGLVTVAVGTKYVVDKALDKRAAKAAPAGKKPVAKKAAKKTAATDKNAAKA